MEISFVGGRTHKLIRAISTGIVGIILILAGLISALIYGVFMLALCFIGLLALLNAWYWYRRANNIDGKDFALGRG